MKKISVIVLVYEVEKYLDSCVKSLINQTYKNIEIILVDDESPDNCPTLCDNWAKKDERIKVIHKKNGGIADTRNAGLNAVTGDYIGFVDGDDLVSKDMYKNLVEILEKNGVDISACQESRFADGESPVFTNDNKVIVIDDNSVAINGVINDELVLCFLWNKLYKKELWDSIIFPFGKNYEDMFVLYKVVSKAKKVAVTNSVMYGYRRRDNSITTNWSKSNMCNFIEAINARYNDLKNNDKVIDSLNIVKLKSVYTSHVGATIIGDKEFYNSDLLVNEYNFLKKKENRKYYKEFIQSKEKKITLLKIVLLLNRNLFWKIRTRKR